MMTTFALLTEGITDQAVLEIVLYEYYSNKFDNEIDINILSPARDATDQHRAAEYGGWEKVLEHCTITDRLTEVLATNDYIVIQIDTDMGDHVNFGVPITVEGKDRPVEEIIQDTKNLIISKIGRSLYDAFQSKFLFAVCVHSIECWLLPQHVKSGKNNQIKSCEDKLIKNLSKSGYKYVKNYRSYQDIASHFNKYRNIHSSCKRCASLRIFIEALPRISNADEAP